MVIGAPATSTIPSVSGGPGPGPGQAGPPRSRNPSENPLDSLRPSQKLRTTLGIAPPRRPSAPSAPAVAPPRVRRTWLVFASLFALAAAIALVIALLGI